MEQVMDVAGSLGSEQKGEEVQALHRKKKKRDTRKDKKDTKGKKAKAELILCPGRFGKAVGEDKRQICMTTKLQHLHLYYRVYSYASITLEADDKHMKFTQTFGKLTFNAKNVGKHFVIISCKEGGKNLIKMMDVPTLEP